MIAYVRDFGIPKLSQGGDFIKQTITFATIGYMTPSAAFNFFLFITTCIEFNILLINDALMQ